jgi:uncharacterized membrane protein YkvA (DUF1232 family)
MIKNTFFEIALKKAATLAGKKGRLLLLLAQLGRKLKDVDWKSVKLSTAREKLSVLGRFIKAYAMGQYRDVPWKSILIVIAAVVYFVSPIDLLPDFIPITGLTDDFAVLLWVYNSVGKEIDKFLTWEKSQVSQ